MEVEMKVKSLMMDPVTQMPIVILRDPAGESILGGTPHVGSEVASSEEYSSSRVQNVLIGSSASSSIGSLGSSVWIRRKTVAASHRARWM